MTAKERIPSRLGTDLTSVGIIGAAQKTLFILLCKGYDS